MPPRGSDAPDDRVPDDGDATADAATRPARLLAAVQDAALERALLDDGDAVRHLALAGGLERARRAAAEGDGFRRSDPFTPALLAVTTLAAFDACDSGGATGVDANGLLGASPGGAPAAPEPVSPWRPPGTPDDPPTDAIVEGAALAVRRFDADVRRAAALADVPVATLWRRIEPLSER